MYEQLCFSNEIKKNDGKIYNVCNVKRNPIKYYFELKKILTENKFDIVHINLLSLANILPILASKKANIKNIVLHSHNASTPKGIIRKILNKINRVFAIKNSTHLFACSKLAGEWMFGKNKKITIINNAVNFEKFSYNSNIREKIRKELKIEEKFVIGHIGRFSEQKNHTFLIDIFKKVAEKNDNAILLLIGEGELKETIKIKVNKYNLQDRVIFMEPVKNVNDYYQAMDVFVLPSLFEGLPVVGIEAQVSCTNCIFSKSITNELKLTDFCEFVGLDESIEKWVDTILKYINKNKNDNSIKNTLLDNHYNIVKETKKIEKIYYDLVKKDKKILHLVYGLGHGGVESVIYNYFSRINNYELIIGTQSILNEKIIKKFEKIGFSVYELPEKKMGLIKYCKKLYQLIRKEKPDIIHCHMTMGNFLPNIVAFFAGVKIRISHSHFAYAEKSIITSIYSCLGKIFSNRYMACTVDAAHYLFGKNIKNVYILNNAIEVDKFKYSEKKRNLIRHKLNIENNFVIGNVGRFTHQKNHKFLIDIFMEITKLRKDAILLLIGNGELEEEIRSKIAELDLINNVIFLENREDINELMMAMDVFLFPTLFEGLGIVLIEAQSTGLKCICSKNVPKDVKVTKNIKFLDLQLPPEKWARECVNIDTIDRENIDFNAFKNSGYDIHDEVKKLENYYDNIF